MKLKPSVEIPDVIIITLNKIADSRGFFARQFCENELKALNLDFKIAQINTSFSRFKGTLRGLHMQTGEFSETKIIRCIAGSIIDICVDMRPESETYLKSYTHELNPLNREQVYIPKGFLHGYLTLEDNSEVIYSTSQSYNPNSEFGVRWNDKAINLKLPMEPIHISEKDLNHPDLL